MATAASLPPAAFMFDFAAKMGLGKLLICTPTLVDINDQLIEDYKLLMDKTNMYYLSVTASEHCLENLSDFEKSLLLDFGGTDHLFKRLDKYINVLKPESNLCHMPLHLDSRVYTYKKQGGGLIYLKEWYKIHDKCISNDVGWWSPDQGIILKNNNIWSRRSNLHGVPLTNVLIPHATNNFIPLNGKGPTGAMAETVKSMAKALNFTINWKIRKDGEWGAQCLNGSWSGIVGDLAYNKVDFTSTAMWYYPQRAAVMDYGLGIFENSITVSLHSHYGMRAGTSLDGKTYMKTFKIGSWILFWSICLFAGIIFTSFPDWHKELAKQQAKMRHWRFINGAVEYIAAFASKTTKETELQTPSLQWFILYLQLVTLGIYIAFSSALTAEFTSKGALLEPRSFQDMLDIGIRIVLPEKNIPNPIFQNVSPGSAADQVYKDAILVPTLPGEGQASFTRQEEYVGIDPNHRALLQYANNVNNWKKLRHFEERIHNSNALGFPKDSELKELFDYQVIKMHNNGLLDKIHHDTMKQGRPEESNRNNMGVNDEQILFEFSKLGFPATLLAAGVALAALIALAEKYTKCKKATTPSRLHSIKRIYNQRQMRKKAKNQRKVFMRQMISSSLPAQTMFFPRQKQYLLRV